MGHYVPVRNYFPGMGKAVADRTINRKPLSKAEIARILTHKNLIDGALHINPADPHAKAWRDAATISHFPIRSDDEAEFFTAAPETKVEEWEDVARRVALGNSALIAEGGGEFLELQKHMAAGTVLMSGRHLQHGDIDQAGRPMEVFTNCATASTSFLLLRLLLNGAGVGRAYDDKMMVVDWKKMPTVYVTADANYPDRFVYEMRWDEATGQMANKPIVGKEFNTLEWFEQQIDAGFIAPRDKITIHRVEDSREGWAQALEIIERMAFEERHDEVLILDFSHVRPYGSPIRGMQNRPSSGPGPLMRALQKIAAVKFLDIEPWEAAMHIDHYAAECVLVGGARRAARMATKIWSDPTIFGFINIKKTGGLWSSNNSITIDQDFRDRCIKVRKLLRKESDIEKLLKAKKVDDLDVHAWKVLYELAYAAYHDKTGEPGLINQDKLVANNDGVETYVDGLYANGRGEIMPETIPLMRRLAEVVLSCRYTMITNPCGEIALLMLGGYCVIADVVPFHAKDDNDAEAGMRAAVRALIRTNLMDSIYKREVERTNRIGVGITGFHEWAYSRFGFTWHDIVDEKKSLEMWLTLSRFKRAISEEAEIYSKKLGVAVPHTNTTFKPAGTTSKLFGLTEGAHLPPMRWMLRWVQFRNDDPLVEEYRAKGYPTRQLVSYEGTTIVGFPTEPTICTMDGGEWVVTAAEATPEEQYEFLRLLEKYWIVGVAEDGKTPLADTGNQVSYTLKYDPEKVSFEQFLDTLIDGQFSIRCCSVMPQVDTTAYEYQPEEPISKASYLRILGEIEAHEAEAFDMDTLQCASGACPI